VVFVWQRVFIFAVCMVIVLALFAFLRLGKWGVAMRATLQNRDAAALVGIPSRHSPSASAAPWRRRRAG
jgi:branched-subunit amino acid ABC-type transport system permease component